MHDLVILCSPIPICLLRVLHIQFMCRISRASYRLINLIQTLAKKPSYCECVTRLGSVLLFSLIQTRVDGRHPSEPLNVNIHGRQIALLQGFFFFKSTSNDVFLLRLACQMLLATALLTALTCDRSQLRVRTAHRQSHTCLPFITV